MTRRSDRPNSKGRGDRGRATAARTLPARSGRPPSPEEPRLITGPRAVGEALQAGVELTRLLVADEPSTSLQALRAEAEGSGVPVESTSRRELERLAAGLRHQGVIAYAAPFRYASWDEILQSAREVSAPVLVALDQVTDPHNLGALIRSSSALGARGLLTMKQRAAPVTPVVVRTAAGATEHLPVTRVTNLARSLDSLRAEGFEVLGLAGEGTTPLPAIGPTPSGGRVVVVGSEGKGLRRLVRERCDRLIRIPIEGPIASLNASVAGAIALYECLRSAQGSAQPG